MWKFLLLLVVSTVEANQFYGDYYEGDKVLRVFPDTKSKVDDVMKISKVAGLEELDSWMPTFRVNHPADFYANKTQLPIMIKFLQNRSISYSVLVENVTKAILKQRTANKGQRYTNREYNYEEFHPLNEIYEEIDKLGARFSNITKVFSLGESYEGLKMKAIQIKSRTKRRNRKIFFIECGTHPREWLSPATCMWLIHSILQERQVKTRRRKKNERMCNRIDWVIVPVLNVDGYVYSWSQTGRFWRKNRRPNNGSNCTGTDLNRNWGYKWGGDGTNNNTCTPYYRGSAPFSEIETRNVANYLYKHRCQLLGYIGLHSYSQFWMTPWGYKTDRPEDYTEMKRVADVAVNAIKNSGSGAFYKEPGPSSEIIYKNAGSAKDWTYAVLNVQYSYGVELRPHYNGSYGFLVPSDQIKPTGQEIFAAIKAMSTTLHLNEGTRNLKTKRSHDHENA